MMYRPTCLWLALVADVIMVATAAQAALPTCYLLNSAANTDSGTRPCNASAAGTSGSHSTCCKAANSDVCLSSGLCLNTESLVLGHALWATGCTDPTLKDPCCPQICQGSQYGTYGNYALRSCNSNDTVNTWCCAQDDTSSIADCCANSFQLPGTIGDVTFQLTPNLTLPVLLPAAAAASRSTTPSPSPSSCPSDDHSGLVAGVAVSSVIAGIATLGLVVAMVAVQRLKKRAAAAEQELAAATGAGMQQSWPHPGENKSPAPTWPAQSPYAAATPGNAEQYGMGCHYPGETGPFLNPSVGQVSPELQGSGMPHELQATLGGVEAPEKSGFSGTGA